MENKNHENSNTLDLQENHNYAHKSFLKFLIVLIFYVLVVPWMILNLGAIFGLAIIFVLIPLIVNIIGFIQGLKSIKTKENSEWKKYLGTYGNLILLLVPIIGIIMLMV